MKYIQELAELRTELDRTLRSKQSSFAFAKFFAPSGENTPNEMELWYNGKSSPTYRVQIEEAARRVIEEAFGFNMPRGCVLPTTTDRFCILYQEGVHHPEQQIVRNKKGYEEIISDKGDLWVNGFRLYHSKRDNLWKVLLRRGTAYDIVFMSERREDAFYYTVNNDSNVEEEQHVV